MNLTPKVIAVNLSGNKTTYFYTATDVQLLNRNVGDRVVIPNKLKEDGTVSLSIGDYAGIAPTQALTDGLKPIVHFVDAVELRQAQLWLLKAEETKQDAAAAAGH